MQLSYSIGLSGPVSIRVETLGTGKVAPGKIAALIERHFDVRLAGITRQFKVRYLPSLIKGGFYQRLAAYGHMARMDNGLPWESIDKADLSAGKGGGTT